MVAVAAVVEVVVAVVVVVVVAAVVEREMPLQRGFCLAPLTSRCKKGRLQTNLSKPVF